MTTLFDMYIIQMQPSLCQPHWHVNGCESCGLGVNSQSLLYSCLDHVKPTLWNFFFPPFCVDCDYFVRISSAAICYDSARRGYTLFAISNHQFKSPSQPTPPPPSFRNITLDAGAVKDPMDHYCQFIFDSRALRPSVHQNTYQNMRIIDQTKFYA